MDMEVVMANELVTISDKVAFLKDPATYPSGVTNVQVIETHMSWVFLVNHFVYKLKKPVKSAALDLSLLESRHINCREEVCLNRRLAPDIYLGIVPLGLSKTVRLILGGNGGVVDWLVKMKRIPDDQLLDYMIANNEVKEDELQYPAMLLSRYYKQAPPIITDSQQYLLKMKTEIRQLAEELQQPVFSMPTKTIRRLFDTLLKFIMNHMPLFDERVKEGKIIEGHGDLKPAHIKTGPVPAIIDCLEFNVDLRILDAAEDLSGLAMECEHAGNRNVGCYFLKVYELVTGDRVKEALINFYKLKRALLRALLIARHIPEPTYATDSRWSESAQSYLKQAAGYEKNLLAE